MLKGHLLPIMQAAKEGGCDEATVDFFLPLGTTVNSEIGCRIQISLASVATCAGNWAANNRFNQQPVAGGGWTSSRC